LIGGHHIAVGFEQVVHERPDFVEAELGNGVWVENGGVLKARYGLERI
jgi:hypothetical protein